MKTIKLFACLALLCLLFTACSSPAYTDKVSATALNDAAKAALFAADGSYGADADFMTFKFGDPAYVDNYAITFAQSSTDISEYGIFHVSESGKVADMVALAESYLTSYKENWMSNYLAEEYPKIENATVKSFGNYVVYSILDKDDTATLHQTLEALLVP